MNVLFLGPKSNGISGGQANHVNNMKENVFLNGTFRVEYFETSNGLEAAENYFLKLFSLLYKIILFTPFCIRTDVVHINSSFDTKAILRDFLFSSICWIFRKKVVFQYHGGDPNNVTGLTCWTLKKTIDLLRTTSKFICLTDSQFSYLRKLQCISVEKSKNYICRVPKKEHTDYQDVNFFYIGRIVKEKGIFDILKAASLLIQSGCSSFSVSFYGAGADSMLLSNEIRSLNLESHVKVRGNVNGLEKEKAFNENSVLLYPTFYPEGLPYSILESLSFGNPVIATDVGSITLLVKDNCTGFIVPINSPQSIVEAMLKFIDNRILIKELGDNSIRLVEQDFGEKEMSVFFKRLWTDWTLFENANR